MVNEIFTPTAHAILAIPIPVAPLANRLKEFSVSNLSIKFLLPNQTVMFNPRPIGRNCGKPGSLNDSKCLSGE